MRTTAPVLGKSSYHRWIPRQQCKRFDVTTSSFPVRRILHKVLVRESKWVELVSEISRVGWPHWPLNICYHIEAGTTLLAFRRRHIFVNENLWNSRKISLTFVLKFRIINIPASVHIIAWCRPYDKPLPEPKMVSLLTHICVTQPQWDYSIFIVRGINYLIFCSVRLEKTYQQSIDLQK